MSKKEPLILNGIAGTSVAAGELGLSPPVPSDLLIRGAFDKLSSSAFPDLALVKVLQESTTLLSHVYVPVTSYSPLLYVMPADTSPALVILGSAPGKRIWSIKVSWTSTMLGYLQQP